jgi:excisionase family DNA binding protein
MLRRRTSVVQRARLTREPADHLPRRGKTLAAAAVVALGSCTLKRPKRAMVGAWSGPDNRSVRPPSSTATEESSRRNRRGSDEYPVQSGPGTVAGVRARKGCAVAAQRSGKAATTYPSYLRTAQVADLLYVSPKTVSRWAKEGKLPFLKTLGGHRRFPEAEIRELAEELREEAITQA